MDTGECDSCIYRLRAREEARRLLRLLMAAGSLRDEGKGYLTFESEISPQQAQVLCQWEAACEDCEDSHDQEDSFDREEDRSLPWQEWPPPVEMKKVA
jgi:hypothetical protein